jgi:hypothetical protein
LDLFELAALNRPVLYSDALWERLGDHDAYSDLDITNSRIGRWDPLNQSLYVAFRVMFAGLLMVAKGDRVARAASIETRYPFLDHDVITFCAAIAPKYKLHGMTDKWILRQVAARALPPRIAHRPKTMFRANLSATFLGADRPAWVDQPRRDARRHVQTLHRRGPPRLLLGRHAAPGDRSHRHRPSARRDAPLSPPPPRGRARASPRPETGQRGPLCGRVRSLISGILAKVPKDPRVVTAVRALIADHAEDEGRHSAFFSQFFTYLWPRLGGGLQVALGPLLPQFILAFREPDADAIRGDLARLPLLPAEIDAVVAESYPPGQVIASARQSANVTLHLFAHQGLMDDPRIADSFRKHGLMD